ncbi:hypothetical protein [Novipirellula aureliae]|uniref:hypothetical protein n=1 Tax=Novipirellula aureliae TaxID=2527966 RepID=UPI0018CD94D2|nr:hypothetical protein [Novipirellula aureliae]
MVSACMLDQFSVSTESTILAAECGGVLDILPRLFQDRPEHPGLLAQFIEDMPVVSLEFFAVALQQAGPIESFGHDLFVVRRLRLLVGHFQKEQKRDLLGVSHVGKQTTNNYSASLESSG